MSSRHRMTVAPVTFQRQQKQLRCFSKAKSDYEDSKQQQPLPGTVPFRPRPRSAASWKLPSKRGKPRNPMKVDPRLFVNLGDVPNPKDELEADFGPFAADVLRDVHRKSMHKLSLDEMVEEHLRMADYMIAETGSTEDLVGERRAMADAWTPEEAQEAEREFEEMLEEERFKDLNLEDDEEYEGEEEDEFARLHSSLMDEDEEEILDDEEERDTDISMDRNQLAHGDWGEYLVTVDRTVKLWRGGRLESYRALVVGGNGNGCAGFGIGKNPEPVIAVDLAGRMSKRNIFFVDRYQNNGLTRDLVGKQNSCKVVLRATDNGLTGNDLCGEILKRFGITNCSAKTYGNRNLYSVVRATFKALKTHESIEDVALKRGKRLVSIDRARRMQI